ncbi:hypothetical protein M9458_030632, partial [Cirrhinus mrigala]
MKITSSLDSAARSRSKKLSLLLGIENSSQISWVETQSQEEHSLSPAQRTTYLGVVWDSITMQAQLSPARVESILNTQASDSFGPPAHETISVVAQSQGISSKGQSPEANKDYAASYPFYVIQTPVSDFWSHSRGHLLDRHINCLEMMAVFRALKYFLQHAGGQYNGGLLHKTARA